ncbi:MAG: HAD-IIA family hydrolase [bacterium]
MKQFGTYIFDLDGVLYRSNQPVQGASEVVLALINRGAGVYFVTNNSSPSRQDVTDKLNSMGFPCTIDQVVTSGSGTAQYLRQHGAEGKKVFVVGGEGMKCEMKSAGLIVVEDPTSTSVDFVVVGIDRQFTYERLKSAQQAILNGAQFFATNRDPTYPIEGGLVEPGGGAIVAAIEVASGKIPPTIGKPEPFLYEVVLNQPGVEKSNTLAVGDRLDTDILGGKRAGLETALVLTGVTSRTEAANAPLEMKPDYIINTLKELTDNF